MKLSYDSIKQLYTPDDKLQKYNRNPIRYVTDDKDTKKYGGVSPAILLYNIQYILM